MPPRSKQNYTRYLNYLASRYGSLEDKTIRRIQSMLKTLRGEVSQEVLSLEGFEAYRLNRLKSSIDRLIDRFNLEATKLVNDSMVKSLDLGETSVTGPLKRIGIDADKEPTGLDRLPVVRAEIGVGPTTAISPQQAMVAMDYSADLIQAITDPMRSQINKRIRMAIVGRKSPIDMMREITQVLGVEAKTGIWKKRKDPVRGIAARAETDLRTELQRAYNLAHSAKQKSIAPLAAKQGVVLLKGWTATADMRTRKSHLMAHRKYGRAPIPIDEPFILIPQKGKNKGKKFELMYPGDPNGPPELTVNCR